MLTETWRNIITLPWTQIYSGTKVHKFQECIKMCSHFQIVSETLTFRFRHFMAQPCRADSPHRVFNTVELLHTDMQTCFMFQTRDGSHAAEIPLASLMVCRSFEFVMDSVFLDFTCSIAFGASNVSHVAYHAKIAAIRISLGQGFRERVRQILTCRDTKHFQTSFLTWPQEVNVNMSSFPQSLPSTHASCRAAVAKSM